MALQQLIEQLKEIKNMGFVKTHRADDTGIGKTLEDLLGIEENNLRIPDVGDIEVKAKRIDSNSMLTLATKAPKPRGVNRILFETYKYKNKDGFYNLHSTVYGSRTNPQSFQIIFKDDKLVLRNRENIEAYWPISIFHDVLESKSNKILLVYAETKGKRKTKKEHFHYTEAYLLSDLDIEKFEDAIRSNKLKVDIRIGVYRSGKRIGKYHDHGTGFRIHKRDFLDIFNNYQKLI